ncbi:MAG: hypothetical protein BLM47_04510 [Candidatus Reconcilbacillus cellulovorans]|uniref:Squalene cyclase C-terminal domain-containing protein n=1 Tax=Candidatus Reconcilbacillus cellulovorans TaxID=1906605 RepID=A0A2A6E1C4_9BACL|nr:MAG: hypothetical protein BLM47_04510 [Candidatus Reconcilbacillus cellulovorans]
MDGGAENAFWLRELETLFDGFADWLRGQYDPKSGGFFYARSSKASGRFSPDIESTAQAIHILDRVGALDGQSDLVKERFVCFFQKRQDPETGCFYDADPRMRKDEVMVARALGYATGVLTRLGAGWPYPSPNPRRGAPAWMRSPEAFGRWVRDVDLSHSWRGCDRLSCSAVYLAALAPQERAPYLEAMFAYLERVQDAATGFWGGGSGYVRVSGAFKLHTFYARFGEPVPRAARLLDSVVDVVRDEAATDMCYVRNAVHLVASLGPTVRPGRTADVGELIAKTVRHLRAFKRDDGGFSREMHRSVPAPNVAQVKEGETYPDMPEPVVLGEGAAEGDMNAGTQAVLVRRLCYRLAGVPEPPLPGDWQLEE